MTIRTKAALIVTGMYSSLLSVVVFAFLFDVFFGFFVLSLLSVAGFTVLGSRFAESLTGSNLMDNSIRPDAKKAVKEWAKNN